MVPEEMLRVSPEEKDAVVKIAEKTEERDMESITNMESEAGVEEEG